MPATLLSCAANRLSRAGSTAGSFVFPQQTTWELLPPTMCVFNTHTLSILILPRDRTISLTGESQRESISGVHT